MKLLLLFVCSVLAVIRHPRTSPRRIDKVRIGALSCTAAVIATFDPVAAVIGKAGYGVPDVLSLTLFLLAIWCTQNALMDAVRRSRHRARQDRGVAILLISCLLCWLTLLFGDSGYMPDGTPTGLPLAIALLYVAGSCSEVALAAAQASRLAHTGGVRAGSGLLGISAGALSIIAVVRVAVYVLLLGGVLTESQAGFCQQAGVVAMTAAGTAGFIGLAMPALVVLKPWLHDALWALRCLKCIRPLWDRAIAGSYGHLGGTKSVSRADPVARLHRRVVEIRDAELAKLIHLRTRETAMIESIEEKLTRGSESREAA